MWGPSGGGVRYGEGFCMGAAAEHLILLSSGMEPTDISLTAPSPRAPHLPPLPPRGSVYHFYLLPVTLPSLCMPFDPSTKGSN